MSILREDYSTWICILWSYVHCTVLHILISSISFFGLRWRFPPLPWVFTVWHNDRAAPQDHCFFVATVSDLRRGSVVDKPCTYTSRCPSMPVADITDCPTMQSRWNMKYSYTVKCCNWQMKVWKLSFQEVFKSGCVRQKGRSGREREWIYRKKS